MFRDRANLFLDELNDLQEHYGVMVFANDKHVWVVDKDEYEYRKTVKSISKNIHLIIAAI